jgi:hypothetical protein
MVNSARCCHDVGPDFNGQVTALFEAPGIGHDGALKAFNPGRLVNMAAQAEADRMFCKKRLYTVTAAPQTKEGPVPDTPGWSMRDQDDFRRLLHLLVSRLKGKGNFFLRVFRGRMQWRRRRPAYTEKADPLQYPAFSVQAVPFCLKEVFDLQPVPVAMDGKNACRILFETGNDIGRLGPRFSAGNISGNHHPICLADKWRSLVDGLSCPVNVADRKKFHAMLPWPALIVTNHRKIPPSLSFPGSTKVRRMLEGNPGR